MSPTYYRKRRGSDRLLDDHGAEGISVLTDEPSRFIRTIILTLLGALVAAFTWSFLGRADVVVSASGVVTPGEGEQSIHVPVKGVLTDVYVAEGMPVRQGDVMFRVDSPAAIQLLGDATTTGMELEHAEKDYAAFPARKIAKEKELLAMREKIDADQDQHEKRVEESIARLAEKQTLELRKARADVEKARREATHAEQVLGQHERLYNSVGGGGISRQKVDEKRKNYQDRILDLKLAEVKLGEFELSLKTEYDKKKAEIQKKSQELLALQSRYESSLLELANEGKTLRNRLRLARAKARVASRIKFDDIDEDNFLRIRAPRTGVVTMLAFDKVGQTVDEKKPAAVIALDRGHKVLDVTIEERDRAFLRVGMSARIKVNAFPYQRYGYLKGELQYISPSTHFNHKTKRTVYKGRIKLERDYFEINQTRVPVRYGMEAKTEIAVRKRRIVDMALDPFRNLAG